MISAFDTLIKKYANALCASELNKCKLENETLKETIKEENDLPKIKLISVTVDEIKEALEKHNITVPLGFLDAKNGYYSCSFVDWGKVWEYLCFKSSLYVTNKFDCENYAFKAMVTSAEKFGLNTLGVALGFIKPNPNADPGYHGFNLMYVVEDSDFMCWEPNIGFSFAGEPFKIGEHGYKPDRIVI